MTAVIARNNIAAKLVKFEPDTRAIIADLLAFDVDGSEHTDAYQLGIWNGRKTFLRPDDTFEAGFIDMIRRVLRERGIPVSVLDYRPKIEVSAGDFSLIGITPYDYQVDAALKFLEAMCGVIKLATGGGKTEVFMMLAKYLGLPTLFLTHKIDLVDQTAERIRQRLGRQVGTIAEGSWNPSEITVASVQTIMSHWQIWWRVEGEGITKKSDGAIVPMSKTLQAATQLEAAASAKALGMTRITAINVHRDDRLMVDNFLMSIRFFVADEAHRVSGASFFKIAGATRSANYRLGLSATAGLKESREDNLKLIAATGDIIVHIGVKQLVDSGHLAQPRFKLQQVPMPRGVYKSTAWQQAYDAGIVRNDIRNAMVLEAAWNERSRKPIVLVQREDHGNRLLEIAKAHGMNALWIYGKTGTPKTKTKVRREALDQLRDGQIDAIICSTIFDEGVDEKSIGCIVNGGGMKSLIGLYQRVGRGSRLKRDGRAEELVVYDFIDMLNMHLLKHSAMRYRAISEEEGWIIDEIRLWEESRRSELLMSWGPQSSIPPVMFNGRQISLSF